MVYSPPPPIYSIRHHFKTFRSQGTCVFIIQSVCEQVQRILKKYSAGFENRFERGCNQGGTGRGLLPSSNTRSKHTLHHLNPNVPETCVKCYHKKGSQNGTYGNRFVLITSQAQRQQSLLRRKQFMLQEMFDYFSKQKRHRHINMDALSAATWALVGNEGSLPFLLFFFLVVFVVLIVLVLRLIACLVLASAPLGPRQPVFYAPPTSSFRWNIGITIGQSPRVD